MGKEKNEMQNIIFELLLKVIQQRRNATNAYYQ